jgi:hypothetical protein
MDVKNTSNLEYFRTLTSKNLVDFVVKHHSFNGLQKLRKRITVMNNSETKYR